MNILNLLSRDPFTNTTIVNNDTDSNYENEIETMTSIHIRVVSRNNRKKLTLIEGLSNSLDLDLILKYFKQTFCCNGTITKIKSDKLEETNVLQLQGDQHMQVFEFLIDQKIADRNQIVLHAY